MTDSCGVRTKEILKTKKIGHTGTLDPEAEGVLVCCIGKATKLVDTFINHDKIYESRLLLGRETDTYDIWGETKAQASVDIPEDEIESAIASFTGRILQVPPMYSAKKVDGKKLYELAREGRSVERAAVPIEIYALDITDISLPEVTLIIHCSKGTYIRSLCHDIGKRLGCGGCMSGLKRLRSGDFSIDKAHSLAEIERAVAEDFLDDILIPTDEVLGYRKAYGLPASGKYIENGNSLKPAELRFDEMPDMGEMVCVYHPDGRFAGTYCFNGDNLSLDKFLLEQ